MFLVRRKCTVRKKERVCTYHIPVSPDTVNYFDQIITDTQSLLKLLIDSFLLSIRNKEGFYILPIWRNELKLTEKEKMSLDLILKKSPFIALPKEYSTQIRIHDRRKEIIRRAFAKNHIYRNCRFDIYKMKPEHIVT